MFPHYSIEGPDEAPRPIRTRSAEHTAAPDGGESAGFGHSIHIDPVHCLACAACTTACPTKAIRVREGVAKVKTALCIDCGECIRACKYGAAQALTSTPADVKKFKYTVAIPSLTLYAQFGRDVQPAQVLTALTKVGFDSTYDMSWMCEMVAGATDAWLSECEGPWPKISVTCPAIVRLVQLRYPDMLANLAPIETARELTAKLLRRKLSSELGLEPPDIGIFFITPCSAIMNSVLNPVGLEQSYLDGAISIAEIYAPLLKAIKEGGDANGEGQVSPRGLLWAMAGGEISGMRNTNTMTVRGVQDVQFIFDRIEAGKFQSVDFIEAYICPDGCVSGGLTMEGRYSAQRNIQRIARRLEDQGHVKEEKVRSLMREHFFDLETEIRARSIQPITKDLRQAIAWRRQRATLLDRLPRRDCAACGAPDCETLAEDVLQGEATLDDCVFVKLERLEQALRAKEEGGK
jgi:iron only hydrogenase large subunit-like protein